MKDKKISAVVSVYNEELSLRHFYQVTSEILEKCAWDYEIVFVNDGSQDKSMEILTEFAQANEKVKVVNFARNFGHEAAMIAGIDHAGGDGIVCMDADLQHPPESIPAIIEKFEEGYEVISMIRTKNEGAGVIKKITSAAFYRVLNMMSPVKFENNSSDFFAISKNVAEVLRQDYREKVRYLRGYVQSVGFKKTTLEFEARDREAGESKYSIRKLMHFSINALCSFSDLPVKAWYLFRHLCRIVRSDLNDLYDRQQVCLWCAGRIFYDYCGTLLYVCDHIDHHRYYRRIYFDSVCRDQGQTDLHCA